MYNYYQDKYFKNNTNYSPSFNYNQINQNYYNNFSNKDFYYNNNYNYKYNYDDYKNNYNNHGYFDYNYYDYYSDSDSDDEYWEDDYLEEDEYYDMLTSEDKNENSYMYKLPDIKNRIIIIDTEVSGITEKDNIIEICALEMIDGKLTGKKFHSFFKPKNHMSNYLIKMHKIPKKAFFYTREQEINLFLELLDFIKNSLIVTHNAEHDLNVINKGLTYYHLPPISKYKFRCSMRIFYELYNEIPTKFSKLKECCQYFKIKFNNKRLHLASYDAFLVGKVLEKIYEDQFKINKNNYKDINNNTDNFYPFNNNKLIEIKPINSHINTQDSMNNINYNNKGNKNILNNSNLNIIQKNDIKNNKDEDLELENLINNNIEKILDKLKEKEEDEDDMDKFLDENLEDIIENINKDKDNNKKKSNKNDSLEDFINNNIEDIISSFNEGNKRKKGDKKFIGKKRK